ncbi:N4-gp56 family major capsid protein [Thioalkalivibrio sp. ALE12]|uniref:N4-gp56 family major capsid protein n=1 Tax=Thioalkalivibrio sp. ALE12 TaxID=1158170 RepID=UPI00038193A3|nr:N4-gp56 family major capsid protein [Thioalkalivibrio sp. ALE12]
MALTEYGDISPRTAAYAAKEMLKRGMPYLVLEKFGQSKPLPKNKTDTVKFRRYEALDNTPAPLTEGVTPSAKKLTKTDVSAQLQQYGDLIQISDVIEDTHEDPVLNESVEILGEQQAQMLETVRFNVIKAGTNVFYSDGSARADVASPVSRNLQRKITRSLKRQNGRKITSVVRSTPSYGTQNVAPSYIGLVHPDLESDIRNMDGFVPTEEYGSMTPYESEIGKVEDVRYVASTIFEPWEDAGGDPTTNGVLSASGGSPGQADVYPILYIARDSFGIVPLKGKGAVSPSVVNPSSRDKSDPLGQRGFVGWKAYQAAVILNDAWLVRAEVAVSDL